MQDKDRYDPEEEVDPGFDYDEREDGAEPPEEREEEEPGKKRGSVRLLTSIQIFGSLAVLAAALVFRMIGGDTYQKVRAWYFSAVNDSLVAEEQTEQVKRTMVGLWNDLSAGRLQGAEPGEQTSGAASAAGSVPSQAPSGTASAAAQSGTASTPSAQG